MLDAFRGNYTLEVFHALRSDARGFEDLDDLGSYTQHTIRTITKLNSYLATNASSRHKGVQVLASVSDDLDCLFYHLLENPSLCCFPRDPVTQLRRSKRKYAKISYKE